MSRDSIIYFIVRIGNGVFTIAALTVFTRILSPEEYGFYALAMAVATIGSGVLFQWLNFAISRFYPLHLDDPDKVMDVVSYGFWVTTAVATLIFVVLIPFLWILGTNMVLYILIFIIIILMGIYSLALQIANSESNPILYGQLSWAKGGVFLLAGWIFIHYGLGEIGALLGYFTGLVLAVVGITSIDFLRIKRNITDKKLRVNMFRYGLPLVFNTLAIAAVDVADRFMIGNLLGVAQVAPYAVAYDIVQLSLGPTMNVLFIAAFPLIVKAFDLAQNEDVNNRLHDLGRNLLGIGLPVATTVGFFAGDIAEIILGNEFRQDAIIIIPWLAAAIFVGAFKSFYLDVVFQLSNSTKCQGYIALFMVAINIILNLILLPIYGVIAAAWSTLAAFIFGALLSWVLGRSLFNLPSLSKDLLQSGSATVTMVILLYLLPTSSGSIWIALNIFVAVLAYIVLAWALDIAGFRRLFK